MKFNRNILSPVWAISKFSILDMVARPVYCLRIEPLLEAFYSSASHREKLQIIYANLRV